MRQRNTTRGTTLAELAAGIAFVAISLLGAISAVASGSALAKSTAETREAQRVTAGLMEEIRSTDFDNLAATYDGVSRPLDGIGGSSSGTADVSVVQVDDGSTRWSVLEVTVLVSWDRPGDTRDVRMVALFSDRARGSGIAPQTVQQAQP